MLKRIAVTALMLGSALAIVPAHASAQVRDFYHAPYVNREAVRHDIRVDERRDFDRRVIRNDVRHGYYDRGGCWHR